VENGAGLCWHPDEKVNRMVFAKMVLRMLPYFWKKRKTDWFKRKNEGNLSVLTGQDAWFAL
jgi:hypothetical protein